MTGAERKKSVAFTGHRTFKAESRGGTPDGKPFMGDNSALRTKLIRTVEDLARCGFTDFYCGMAEGFDLLAALTILELRGKYGLRLHAVVPFRRQAEGFPARSGELYRRVLTVADSSVCLSENYSPGCFHRRNDYLLEKCSVVVAYYDGVPGGTEYTVKKALGMGLEIINLAGFVQNGSTESPARSVKRRENLLDDIADILN